MLRDAPDQERDDDGGTCSKSSCQSLHTARDQAGRNAQQEVGLCRRRLNDYLAEQRRRDERARRDAEEAERDRRDRERSDHELDQQHAEQQKKADREHREIENRAARERQDARDRAADAELQRLQAESSRQAYLRAVELAASRVKSNWHEHIRSGISKVRDETHSFMDVAHGLFRGDPSVSFRDLVDANKTLLNTVKEGRAWINEPLQLYSDQVVADTVQLVRADKEYQHTDSRIQAVFAGISKMNAIVNEMNPFAKAWNASVHDELKREFQSTLGAMQMLESQVGSFTAKPASPSDPMRRNPFVPASATTSQSPEVSGNPWASRGTPVQREEHTSRIPDQPEFTEQRNPFLAPDTISAAPSPSQTPRRDQEKCVNKEGNQLRTKECEQRRRAQGTSKATR